jgi:hypothetical protein
MQSRHQAAERFHTEDIAFQKIALDDNPGRQDWVTDLVDVRRGDERDALFRFSRSVNFAAGESWVPYRSTQSIAIPCVCPLRGWPLSKQGPCTDLLWSGWRFSEHRLLNSIWIQSSTVDCARSAGPVVGNPLGDAPEQRTATTAKTPPLACHLAAANFASLFGDAEASRLQQSHTFVQALGGAR